MVFLLSCESGFNREDVRIMLINENQVWAYGDRSKYPGFGRERLHYNFQVPKDADPKKITAAFDDKTRKLVITISKFDQKDSKVDASPATTSNKESGERKEEHPYPIQTDQGQLEGAVRQSDNEQGPIPDEGKGISGHGKKNDHEELLMFILRTVLEFLKERTGLNTDEKSVDEARKDEYLVATAAVANKVASFALEKLRSSSRQ